MLSMYSWQPDEKTQRMSLWDKMAMAVALAFAWRYGQY